MEEVIGSIPIRSTNKINSLQDLFLFFGLILGHQGSSGRSPFRPFPFSIPCSQLRESVDTGFPRCCQLRNVPAQDHLHDFGLGYTLRGFIQLDR